MKKGHSGNVRHPTALAELTKILEKACDQGTIAAALSIPKSTVYRWTADKLERLKDNLGDAAFLRSREISHQISQLVGTCEQNGYAVRHDVDILLATGPLRLNTAEQRAEHRNSRTDEFVVVDATTNFGVVKGPASILEARGVKVRASLCGKLLLARREIEQHFYLRHSCERLALSIGVSKFEFIRAFRKLFDISPYQFLLKVRLERAKHMIALTDQPMHQIAASVGFSSGTSFIRAFKRCNGVSPSDPIYKVRRVRAGGLRTASFSGSHSRIAAPSKG